MDQVIDEPLAEAPAPVRTPIVFSGNGSEFFKIWIVNVALTIVTIGIYSAWATVRTRRYFYGHTSIDGSPLQFTAKPIPILIGRLIALAIFGSYSLSGLINPFLPAAVFVFIILPLIPWMISKSLQFRARYTSWRNIRFAFDGGYGGAAFAYILMPIVAYITATIALPVMWKETAKYQANHSRLGNTKFSLDRTTTGFWSTYGLTVLSGFILILVGVGLAALVAYLSNGFESEPSQMLLFGIGLLVYLPLILLAFFVKARLFNTVWKHTALGEDVRFAPNLPVLGYTWIQVSNLFLVLFTLGFGYPWAKVRAARYSLDHLALLAPAGALTFDAMAGDEEVGASGAEMATDFGFDISFF